jgi:hypothetical protein
MQPKWCSNDSPCLPTNTGTSCCFDLKRCTGGKGAPLRDLSYLPLTAPPLLGRTAMARMSDASADAANKAKEKTNVSWSLNWNGRQITVQSSNFNNSSSSSSSSPDGVEIVTVHEPKKSSNPSTWVFLNDQFRPNNAAKKTYAMHTKKNVEGIDMIESVSIFFRIGLPINGNSTGEPLPPRYGINSISSSNSSGKNSKSSSSTSRGRIHAVLPTKLSTPFGFHVQGNWLLSVVDYHI